MKITLRSSVIITCVLFFSCAGKKDEWQNASELIANVWGASTSDITLENANDSSGKEIREVVLNLSGFKSVPSDYPSEQITSTSAMLIVQNVSENSLSSCENIRIRVNDRNEEKSYAVKGVKEAIDLLTTVTDFLEAPSMNGLDERKRCVDSSVVSDSLLMLLSENLANADSIYGPTSAHQIGGFNFGRVAGTNEPVLIVWATSAKRQSQIPYTFFVSRKTRKIISFSLDHTMN